MMLTEKYAEIALEGNTKTLYEYFELLPEDENNKKEKEKLNKRLEKVKNGIKEKFKITWTPEISPELENKRWWDKIKLGYILIANGENTRIQIPYEEYENEMGERKKIMRKTIMEKTTTADPYKPRTDKNGN